MFCDPSFMSYPWVCMFKDNASCKCGSFKDNEKLGKQLKYTGPMHRLDSIIPNKESWNLLCLLSIKYYNIEVFNPSLVNGFTAIWIRPKCI